MSSIMDFNWNSESTADGAWHYGTGGQEIEWSSYRNAGFSSENYQWLLRSDPLLAPGPYESSLDWPELGPRKEALALADHSLYCLQANEIMDPYAPNDDIDYSQYGYYDDMCPNEEMQMPSTSSTPPSNGPPAIDPNHMQWLETFGPIDYDISPSDLDDTANNVDWDSWVKYLEDEEGADSKKNVIPMLPAVPKQEEDYYVPQYASIGPNKLPKEEEPTAVFNNYPVKIKEELEDVKDVKPVIGRPSSRFRFSPYEAEKPKRGRPKKIRVPEDQDKMSLNERRKAMNRDAALRYRERKKEELEQLKYEADDLEVRNQILNEQASQLQQEIRIMKIKLNSNFDLKFSFL
ncbi:hypothetical protein PENTCL1PPCAC_2857 [Pristionchus entomophagus]|uniref:BZIP domain-containing protein n=1 Tax=Pristionchus entomophagus TaxID=358040 RepID=A0AAV5SBJ8_9BILA|nr:hypothetical protein PENTCL1PPCAC_2857 [Pristionchus entomophagus]